MLSWESNLYQSYI